MTQILVIEDDPTVRNLILKLLTAEGFDAMGASNGRVGIQLAEEHGPDLIICDVMMPECDGYEVLKHLSQSSHNAGIPFIFLSAKADRSDLRQGMELGADDYLTKPFTRAELLGAIAARLAKQAAVTQPYIDEVRRAVRSLNQMAYRDPLTNLPNRILLHHRLQSLIELKGTLANSFAVLCLSLNRFKAINAMLGFSGGDCLLQQVAERLTMLVPQDNAVARLGGDEFGVVLEGCSDRQATLEAAQGILAALVKPYLIDGQPTHVQFSLGIALYPDDATSPDQLLSQSDTAMRFAKAKKNGSQVCAYTPEMDVLTVERQLIESSIGQALDLNQFYLHYQPQVNLVTGRIIGAEALLRWHHPQLGQVSPCDLIPAAEETGQIVAIGLWVLRTACAQAQQWQCLGYAPVRMSVNLSARQFRQLNLVEMIAQVLEQTQLAPDLLVLELTETCVMEDVESTIVVLNQLRSMGVHISIDDFGTGYSSLNYLKRFPIDSLKIDRSFVKDIPADSNDAAIAKAIIAMAHSLNLKVVAEGVETREQIDFLKQNGCHAFQGFLFSPPVSQTDFQQLMTQDKRLYLG